MEDLIPVLIFIVVGILSLVSKMQEQKRNEEKKKQQQQTRKVKPEDLPEATRRMLFGTPDMPKPRQQQVPVRMAEPKGPPPVPHRQPVQQPARRPEFMREIPKAPERQEAPPQRQQTPLPRPVAPKPISFGFPVDEQEQYPARVDRPRQQAVVRRKVVETKPVRAPAQARRRAVQDDESGQAQCRRRGRAFELFANMDDVRRGIVLSEILGKPRAFRPYWG